MKNNYDVRFSKFFKERNNQENIGTVRGNVLSIEPLKFGILNNGVIIDTNNGYICSNLIENYERNAKINSGTDTIITFKDILKVGDMVLVIADALDQKYYIVDKVVAI